MRFVTMISVTYEATEEKDAEHLRDIMVNRLDEVTPESTKIKGYMVKQVSPAQEMA